MNKTLLFAAAIGAAFGDHSFSGTRDKQHKAQRRHFDKRHGNRHEKSRWFRSHDSRQNDQTFFKRRYMTGNWDGARVDLAKRGWTFISSYAHELQWNVDGGRERGFGQCGSFGLNINVDFNRLAHIPGLSFNVGFVSRSGVNLTTRKIGNQFSVSQLYGSETYLLDVLYFQQTGFDGAFLLKAGRLNAGDDFLQSDTYYRFVSNAFCGNPVGIFLNTPFSAYPNATWGAFASVKPSENAKWKFAVYNGNTIRKLNKYHGAYFSFKSDAGAVGVTEIDWTFGQKASDWWYPASYKVGTYGVSQKVSKYGGGAGYNFGTYIQFDQTLYLPSKKQRERGLKAFGSLVLAPKDRNEMPLFFTTGLVYQGIFKNRAQDALCLGLARGGYSSLLRQSQVDKQHYEAVFEANYWVYLSPWWYIAPDYQYIMHPNGQTNFKNAHVVGFQTGLTF